MGYVHLLSFLVLFACSNPKQKEAQLTFQTKEFSLEKCINEECATVDIKYLIAENADVAEQINADIYDQLLSFFGFEMTFESLDSAAAYYLDSFIDFKKDFPDAPGGWFEEINVDLTYESDSTLSFQFTSFNFSGGAHPNSSVYYMNYDTYSGEFLSTDRVVLDEDKMLEIAEKAFREFHDVADNVSLEEDGRFFLPEIGFFLPNAMGYVDDKFVLSYNPYEIGPYVMGYTDLEFDLKDLVGIVRTK